MISLYVLFYSAVEFTFTEDDFRVNEGNLNPQAPVRVTKNKRIANPVVLEVIPMTIAQAKNDIPSFVQPENIPDNAFSPPYAGNTCTNLPQCVMWL